MLSQPLPLLHIPKYVSSTAANFLTRPKLTAATFSDDNLRFRSPSPVVLDNDFSVQPSYHYGGCAPQFDSPISPGDMYEGNPLSDHFNYQSSQYSSGSAGPDLNVTIPRGTRSIIEGSSSPEEVHPSLPNSSFYHASDETYPHNTETISKSYSRDSATENVSANGSHNSYLDQRRMSEPAVLGPQNSYISNSATTTDTHPDLNQSYGYTPHNDDTPRVSSYIPSLTRGASMSSLRGSRAFWTYSSPPRPDYARISREKDARRTYVSEDGFDGPISPLQSDFTGGLPFSSTGIDQYGPSPPNTGTSTSSAPLMSPTSPTFPHDDLAHPQKDSNGKTYAFVALPGNSVKKRPRRRYDEIERLYRCSWPECTKSYGTLNHLNAHVTMQKHGPKRSPGEFKEMRKQWRKQKKDQESHAHQVSTRRDTLDECSPGRYEHDSRRSPNPDYSLHSGHFSTVPMSVRSAHNGRYPPGLHRSSSDRDDSFALHASQLRHRPELDGTPASWHATSRGSFPDYMGSSLPTNTFSNHGLSSNILDRTASPSMTSGLARLPPDSTLLTPLPGFHHSEMTPVHIKALYNYEYFDDDGTVRPGSGHRHAAQGGGDEY